MVVSGRARGSARERLAGVQRARIVRAMCDVAIEKGAPSVTVADVVERAGVSRRTFYELFADCDACFAAAFERSLAYASERVVVAYESESGWREQIRAGLVALLGFLDEEPVVGRLLIVESAGVGGAAFALRNEIVARLTVVVERGAREARGTPPPLTGEGIVGGVLAVLQSRLIGEHDESLVVLVNPLMSMIVLPYLGAAAARREMERPVLRSAQPVRTGVSEGLLADPFKGTGLRLTYRTVRVLAAIAELGGRGVDPSNRLIADAAEIKDQGQISKLLGRLQRAGMVDNAGAGSGKGMPNAWTLTSRGRQVVSTIRTHTEGRQQGVHR